VLGERGADGVEVVVGSTIVSAACAPVTPGLVGRPSVATPEPAWASSASTWPW
jgi:hypothetical protein